MQVKFKITPAAANAIAEHMATVFEDEYYAHYEYGVWTTSGGAQYMVDLAGGLIFNGSRTSFASGSAWGGVIKNNDGQFRVWLSTGFWDKAGKWTTPEFPAKLAKLETSWRDVPGWDDPTCTEAELAFAQQCEQELDDFEADCLEIELAFC